MWAAGAIWLRCGSDAPPVQATALATAPSAPRPDQVEELRPDSIEQTPPSAPTAPAPLLRARRSRRRHRRCHRWLFSLRDDDEDHHHAPRHLWRLAAPVPGQRPGRSEICTNAASPLPQCNGSVGSCPSWWVGVIRLRAERATDEEPRCSALFGTRIGLKRKPRRSTWAALVVSAGLSHSNPARNFGQGVLSFEVEPRSSFA